VGSNLGPIASENANARMVRGANTKPTVRKSFDFNGFAFYRLCSGYMCLGVTKGYGICKRQNQADIQGGVETVECIQNRLKK
jgi:hypothetical protein